GLTYRMKDQAAPMLDKGFSAFLQDMEARGLLDETLIVALGEFGRSPEKGVSTSGNINSADGRDHWPYCYTAVMAGAGTRRGCVRGQVAASLLAGKFRAHARFCDADFRVCELHRRWRVAALPDDHRVLGIRPVSEFLGSVGHHAGEAARECGRGVERRAEN